MRCVEDPLPCWSVPSADIPDSAIMLSAEEFILEFLIEVPVFPSGQPNLPLGKAVEIIHPEYSMAQDEVHHTVWALCGSKILREISLPELPLQCTFQEDLERVIPPDRFSLTTLELQIPFLRSRQLLLDACSPSRLVCISNLTLERFSSVVLEQEEPSPLPILSRILDRWHSSAVEVRRTLSLSPVTWYHCLLVMNHCGIG